MADIGQSFNALSPIPPRVVSIGYGIFEIPDQSGSNPSIAIPPNYQLFTSTEYPSPSVGNVGDWYEFVTAVSIAIFQKINPTTWQLQSTIPGGTPPGGDVFGPASSVDGDIAIYNGNSGKSIKDSSVTIASSAAIASSSEVPRGNDPRFTNSRNPTAHASTHESGGTDVIPIDELGSASDTILLDSTIMAHGLLPKLSGDSATFLSGSGVWLPIAIGDSIVTTAVTTQFDKTSSATLSDVTGLAVTLEAAKTYAFEATLLVNCDASGRAKASISGTAAFSSLRYEGQSFDIGANEIRQRGTAFGTTIASIEGSVTDGRMMIWGNITTTSSGTLTVQFAQISAIGTSSVLTGSSFIVYPMGSAGGGGGGGGGGSGTVTSVTVINANGVSAVVANPTTTPDITVSLADITPSSVNGIVLSGSSTPTLAVDGTTSVSGVNTGDQTTVSGNSGTATALQTARTINGVPFDGTANIVVSSSSQFQLSVVSSQFDKSNTTLSNITGLSANIVSGTTYSFDAVLFITQDTTGVSKVSIGGTGSGSSIIFDAFHAGEFSATGFFDRKTSMGSAVAYTGSESNAKWQIQGTIVCNSTGTLTVQFAQNSATGTSSVLVGSNFKVWSY